MIRTSRDYPKLKTGFLSNKLYPKNSFIYTRTSSEKYFYTTLILSFLTFHLQFTLLYVKNIYICYKTFYLSFSHKLFVLMPKAAEPSPNYPKEPELIPGHEDHPIVADINSRVWCSYCKRHISIKTFGQHFSNMCQWAVVASGRDWDKVKTSRNNTRRISDKKRYQKIDHVIARNKTRWLMEFTSSNASNS